MELEKQLNELVTEQKGFHLKMEEEIKTLGKASTETMEKLKAIQTQADALDVKLAERHAQAQPEATLEEELKANESIARIMRDKTGQAIITLKGRNAQNFIQRKTTITDAAVGFTTPGVLPNDRTPGIVQEARQALMVRSVLSSRPTTLAAVDFVKVNSPLTKASPQIEASDKKENAVTFTTASERIRTLASVIPASRQVLDDFTELAGFLDTGLRYYVNLAEEIQLLSGGGTVEDLNGLITQATSFDTALLSASAGWNKIDIVGRACQQIMAAKELTPTFIVLHPTDWWGMRLTKDSFGRYILGDPQAPLVQAALFDLTPVVTTSISSGSFLVGSGSPIACEIRDRMELQVEISTSHSDYFTRNLVAIRCEKRLALVVYRPASFITGTLNTSPA
jgi:HK97 family phage major capsid protein